MSELAFSYHLICNLLSPVSFLSRCFVYVLMQFTCAEDNRRFCILRKLAKFTFVLEHFVVPRVPMATATTQRLFCSFLSAHLCKCFFTVALARDLFC